MLSRATFAAAAALGLFTTANAHMFIKSPVPIAGTAVKDPLEDTGANFPCHGAQYVTGKGGQQMSVGSKQILSWELANGANTAVHGGGSCQISVTYETDPEKVKDPKNWKVIYSILGGCPTNSLANLDNLDVANNAVIYHNASGTGNYRGAISCSDPDANGVDCVNSFEFTIPKELKNGKATLAWTWFNTLGNREMYMNCADIEVTGSSDTGSGFSALPNMFVANIAAGGLTTPHDCQAVSGTYPEFPNPGEYVTTKMPSGPGTKYMTTTYKLGAFSGTCGASQATSAAGQVGSSAAATSTPASAAVSASSATGGYIGSSAKATSTPAATDNNGGVFAPGAVSAAQPSITAAASPSTTFATAIASPTGSSVAASVPVASAPAASAQAPGNSSSGSCANGGTSCPTDGAIVCIGSNKWGLCDHGCAVPQALAPGMMCEAGAMKAAAHRVRRHPHGLSHRHRF